jgi:uncharacterized phage protein (TIGR01671 family)
MKDIEFRAWDIKNKKMIYVDEYSSFHKHMTWTGLVYENGKLLDYIMLQYTGLKDKNGKKIFEGDVLRIKETYIGDSIIKEYNGYIYFENGSFNITGEASFDTLAVNASYWEVIGNIYENLELVEL